MESGLFAMVCAACELLGFFDEPMPGIDVFRGLELLCAIKLLDVTGDPGVEFSALRCGALVVCVEVHVYSSYRGSPGKMFTSLISISISVSGSCSSRTRTRRARNYRYIFRQSE